MRNYLCSGCGNRFTAVSSPISCPSCNSNLISCIPDKQLASNSQGAGVSSNPSSFAMLSSMSSAHAHAHTHTHATLRADEEMQDNSSNSHFSSSVSSSTTSSSPAATSSTTSSQKPLCVVPNCASPASGQHGFCRFHRQLSSSFSSIVPASSCSVASVPTPSSTTASAFQIAAFAMNGQGQAFCNFQYAINFCIGKNLDIFFVTEPPRELREMERSGNWRLCPEEIGPEMLAIVYNSSRVKLIGTVIIPIGGNKAALHTQFKVVTTGFIYDIAAAHIDYAEGHDGVAFTGLNILLKAALKQGIHIVMGDLNTYGISKKILQGYFLCTFDGTTANNSPLDKVYYNASLFPAGAPEAGTMPNCIPEYYAAQTEHKRAAKTAAKNNILKKSDHVRGVYVRLPCAGPAPLSHSSSPHAHNHNHNSDAVVSSSSSSSAPSSTSSADPFASSAHSSSPSPGFSIHLCFRCKKELSLPSRLLCATCAAEVD